MNRLRARNTTGSSDSIQAAGQKMRISLGMRIGLLTAFMAVLALAAGAGSLRLTGAATQNMENLRRSAGVAEQQSGVQLGWLGVVGALDTVSITRPTEQDRQALTKRLNDLNQSLDRLVDAGSLGITQAKIAENREILADLRDAYREIDGLANEIYDLAAENRWGTALQRRQSGMAQLQTRLNSDLSRLNTNLQGDIGVLSAQIARDQAAARLLTIITSLLIILLALMITWSVRRSISQPLVELDRQVQSISQGDFSRVKALPRADEIGDLSQSLVRLAGSVRTANAEMEQRIQERTKTLERRTAQVQAAAQTARDIASARSLEQLLENAVEIIRERFGFYHAGIFLTDARGEYQVLRAATGEAGKTMLERGHSLRIGEPGDRDPTGLVGTAAYIGDPQISADVSQDQFHFKNPLLPETRSEVAIPLKTGDRVFGILDVQSRSVNAFDPDSLSILRIMADQLAIAIQNASLLTELQGSLADLERSYGERESDAWKRFFQATPELGYVYDGVNILPIATATVAAPEITLTNEVQPQPYSIALSVRGEEVGALEIWPRWGELSNEETYLLSELNSRLGQILETARLYEETQSRAAREELINRLTTNIARALDMDGVLRAAAVELGSIPAVTEATVKLLAPETAAVLPSQKPLPLNRHAPMDGPSEENGGGNGHRA